jgi:serine phosphatase RsbU (regulator of sigma subunit)
MKPTKRFSQYEEAIELAGKETLSYNDIRDLYEFTWSNVMFLSGEQIKNLLEKLTKFGYVHPQVKVWSDFALAYSGPGTGNTDEGLKKFDPVLEQFRQLGDTSGEGMCYGVRGIINKTMGRLDQAHEDFNLALNMIETGTIYEHFRKVNLYQLAELHMILKDYDIAENFYEICLKDTTPGDGLNGRALNGLSTLHIQSGNYDKAIELLTSAQLHTSATRQSRLYSKNLVDLAICYMRKGENEKAIAYLEESLEVRILDKSLDAAITNYIYLAEIRLSENNISLALELATTADKHAKELNITIKELQTEKILGEIYEKSGDHSNALKHFKNFHLLDRKINGQETARKLEQLRAQHTMQNIQQESEIFRLKNVELKSALDEINESIRYARHLQEAILPPKKFISDHLPESFVLYLPKDIVAGDFYWASNEGDEFIIAAADCTGHGVPGALVSVVCSNAMNRAVKEFGLKEPGKILDKVRELVIDTFERSEQEIKDGMDISLCVIDKKSGNVAWSGANNPLWYISNGEMKEITPNKQPIGKHFDQRPFTTHKINLQKGDMVFCFTDGYADQFGGPKSKKLKYNQLKELLFTNFRLPVEEQKKKLYDYFEEWKGDIEQVDDVCIIGVRIN